MSDASNHASISTSSFTTQSDDSAVSEEVSAAPWETRLWMISCALASLGALLLSLSIWMPWITVTGAPGVGSTNINGQKLYLYLLDPADVAGLSGLFGMSLLSVAGLLLLPFLWQHRSRLGNLLALGGYWIWGILLTVLVSANSQDFQKGRVVSLVPDFSPSQILVAATPVLNFGYWLHFAALGIVTIAALLLTLTLLPGAAWARLQAGKAGRKMRTLSRIPGMGSLTLGLFIWAVGVFLFPWATENCTNTPLLLGTCTGVPFTSTLQIALKGYTSSTFDPLVSLYAVGLLLGIGAVLIFLASWSARIAGGFYVWVALWLLTATFFAVAGDAGVGLLAAHPVSYGLSAGQWTGDDGVVTSFLGLLIGWGALLYLVISARFSESTAPTQARSNP
jgi:hypothetical protein